MAAEDFRLTASYFFRCPWSAIYLVRRPVTIAGRAMQPMQEFAFDVSAEDMAGGGEFIRRLVPGPFHSSNLADHYGS